MHQNIFRCHWMSRFSCDSWFFWFW